MRVLKAGALYFALVFGVGFLLGTVRVLLVTPRIGERAGELIESPLMIAVSFLAARWIDRRVAGTSTPLQMLGAGFVALGILLFFEFTVVLGLRGLTIRESLAGRDRVAGTVYAVTLAWFAILPAWIARTRVLRLPGGGDGGHDLQH